ncbi:MAG TPA: type II secretion system F family protein [Sphingomicrobium sp.]|nr:type II secretion system F family protein [Sphingomicrobium sp.]
MVNLILENQVARITALALLFIAVALISYALVVFLEQRSAIRRRMVSELPLGSESGFAGSLRAQASEGAWMKLVNAIEKAGLSLVDTKDQALRSRLIAAGYTSPSAPRAYTLLRLTLVIALPVLLLGWMWLSGSRPSVMKLYICAITAAVLGLYGPSLFIRARADRRQREIINGFPDALDLMLVCVEAGLGLEAAFARVGQEMTGSHPLLAEQLGAVVLELRAGRSREDALRRMADRAGTDEIRAFATLLIQSTKLGSSIATTLRVYASEMRERRRMRAEEKAHRLPVLLSIPLVVCMLPVMIGVLMLPAIIRVVRVMMPALAGN